MIPIKTKAFLRADAQARFLAAIPRYAGRARRNEGCLAFEWKASRTEPGVVETVETWACPLSAMAHLAAPHARRFQKLAADCRAALPELITLPVSS